MSTRRKFKNNKGFTLLEIVIVLTIIGFLIAMIAPRLGTIGTSSVQIIDDSNIKDMKGYIMLYQQQKNRLPNQPITIVNSRSGGTYQYPLVDDGDVANGPETIGYEFHERCRLQTHVLSKAEADEIKAMGIRKVMVLNDYKGSTSAEFNKDREGSELEPQVFASGDEGRPMNPVEVKEGIAVLMIGAHADSSGGGVSADVAVEGETAVPEWIYRILLGIGPHSALVTEGMVQNEGLSPSGIQNKDFNTYNNYCMILPRLESTVNRINDGEPVEVVVTDAKYSHVDPQAAQKTITLNKKQDLWEVDVCSPLGVRWPRGEVDIWKISEIKLTK